MIYKCDCGKEFTNSQSFNGHRSICPIYLGDKWYLREKQLRELGKRSSEINKINYLKIKEQKKLKWISEQHTCEKCGKVMTEKFGSGRFCSRSCANSRIRTDEIKQKISSSVKCTLNKLDFRPTKSWKNKSGNSNSKFYTGYFNKIYCESSYELIFLIYCFDNNIKVERCPFKFSYTYDNKKHLYFPDFYLPEYDMIIELKGKNQYYKKDVVKLKAESVKDHSYLIIWDEDITNKYIPWILNRYGLTKETLSSFLKNKLDISNPIKEDRKHKPRTKGYKWIHNDILKKSISVSPEKLEQYLNNGWKMKRIFYK